MGLVTRLLEEAERGRAPREADGLAAAGNEDLLLALGERDERQLAEPDRLEGGTRGAQLSLAAVDDHEIGKRTLLRDPAREVAADDLVHRREVVDPGDALDLELPVLGALG